MVNKVITWLLKKAGILQRIERIELMLEKTTPEEMSKEVGKQLTQIFDEWFNGEGGES